MFSIRPANRATNPGVRMRMNPARQMMSGRAASRGPSSAASNAARSPRKGR